MKKFTLSFAFALTIAFTGFTQNSAVAATTDSETSAKEDTRALAQKIGLNEREYITLLNLSREKIARTAEVEAMYSNDPEMRNMKLNEINSHFEARFMAALNAKQVQAYTLFKSGAAMPNMAWAGEDDRSAEELAASRK